MQLKSRYWAMCLTIAAAVTYTGCAQTDLGKDRASENSVETAAQNDTIDSTAEGETLSSISSELIGVTADEDDLCGTYTSFDAEIQLNDSSTTVTGDSSAVTVNGAQVVISAGGTYHITGTLQDGQLLITGTDKVKLYFDSVEITNSTGPAMVCVNEKRTIVSLADGTENSLTDGASYDAYLIEDQEIDPSVIYVQDKLTINGTGTLNVSGNCADGIVCKDDLKLVGGEICVSAANNGIKGKDCVALLGADLTIDAGNDGIKSTETTDTTKGFLQLDSGSAQVTAGGDCFQAETLTRISGGTYTLTSSGTAINTETNESNSAKGIHCTGNIEILGGELTISSPEDGINCNGTYLMTDGVLTVESEEDGVQADGDLTQTGGTMTIITTGDVQTSSDEDEFGFGAGQGGKGGADFGGDFEGDFGGDFEGDFKGNFKGDFSGDFGDIDGGFEDSSSADSTLHQNNNAEITMLTDTETAETATDETDSISSKGVKCGGILTMSGGSCTVTSTDHAVHATGDAVFSGTTLLLNSNNKGISVHGNLTVSDGEIVVETSTEGIESKADLLVSGGTIRILAASDDGINTGGMTGDSHAMTFTGGYTYVCADGDGIDSNASLDISGGTLIVCGPTSGNDGSIDFETTMTYTDGILLALSNRGMMEYGDSGLLVTTGASASAGDLVSVVDADGTVLATVQTPKAVTDVIFGIGDGNADDYQILVGGTYSGTLDINGFATGGTISGGTEAEITVSGSMGGGFGGGGMRGDMQNGEMPEMGEMPDGEIPEMGEMPDGELPEKGEMPDGGMSPDMQNGSDIQEDS